MRTWQANLCGGGVALLVVVGGLFVGAPEAAANGPANPMRLLPPPVADHGVSEIPVGESLELWGQPTRLNMFWTNDTVAQVTRYYVDAWKAAGFEPTVKTEDKVTGVSIVEKTTGLLRNVTIIDQGDERIVMPGLTDVREAPDVTPRHAPVPVPENARLYLASVADDGGSVTYTGSFLLPIGPDRAAEFYRVEMQKLGYQLRENADVRHIRAGENVEFVRGDHEFVRVVATRADEGRLESMAKEGKLPPDMRPENTSLVIVTHTRGLSPQLVGEEKP